MKIGILTRNPKLYSTKRLVEAIEQKGHEPLLLDTHQFTLLVEQGAPNLLYRNEPVPKLDAIIPRIGASITFFGSAVVRQFEQMGIYCLNTSQAIVNSRDKLKAMQILSRHRIGIPVTSYVRVKEAVLPAIQAVGGAPVIIKVLEGTQGVGVILADTTKIAEAIIETLQSARQNVLIQKFVKESKGKDIRAFVVGRKVVAAMRRSAQGEEFRSNVHRGGTVESVKLPPEYEETAIQAAQIFNLHVAGVDMLEGADGPQIMELNSSPGLEGIERASKVDVAGAVVAHIEEEVQFPDFDIRQRLTLTSGYGVAEVPIHPESEVANTAIKDARLKERDILVLSIRRGSVTIPNPNGSREILPGDVLLCYGKQAMIKSLIASRKA